MKTKYLSYAQACAISRDYQHLTGKPFVGEKTIDLITIAPYSRILQWQFLQELIIQGNDAKSLYRKNVSGRFDVLAVSRTDDETDFISKDIRTLLAELGIAFAPERYTCLKNPNIPMHTVKQLLDRGIRLSNCR